MIKVSLMLENFRGMLMNNVLFKKVDYSANYLLSAIETGKYGLPDIQRPFVWSDVKVKELFDSMFKGYPVGYLLLWETPKAEDNKRIGVENNSTIMPSTLIIDGQQRLTSLYAVILNKRIVDKNFQEKKIRIAFNPLTAQFEVASAAHQKSNEWIYDISELFEKSEDAWSLIEKILGDISVHREITPEIKKTISNNISRLLSLRDYPFSALEISQETDEEDVADIFVRINGQGQSLKQSDFILTLVSVFWEEGRREIDQFCYDSRHLIKEGRSSYNRFIEVDPVHIVRSVMCYGFKRAKLYYAYRLLRGRDFETRKYEVELRDKQFKIFKEKLHDILHTQNWHDYEKCILYAGFRNERMISSKTAYMYCYSLYLIGKNEFGIKEYELRRIIARWFFMCHITTRYSGSAETQMQEDLSSISECKSAEEFISTLESTLQLELSNDFWQSRLPNNLETNSTLSPAWSAFNAALVILEAKTLFSSISIDKLLDPTTNANKSSLERHHLFPKHYLEKLGIDQEKLRNQVANYAYVEWNDNIDISDKSPQEYLPSYLHRYPSEEIERMYYWHALPKNWETLEYKEFLQNRRKLMANVIRDAFEKL
jgi:hypothetical protein